jgi:hypothetical protein
MEFSEVIGRLRARMLDAMKLGVGTENPAEFSLTALMQVMNECERLKQDCLRQVQSYRELAKAAEHQASAYGQVHSIVWAVYNGMVSGEERSILERQQREAEDKERAEQDAYTALDESPKDVKPKKGRRGK